jgi:hypothetical protein
MSFVKGLQCRECAQRFKTLEAVASSVEQPYTNESHLEKLDQLYQRLNPAVSQAAVS